MTDSVSSSSNVSYQDFALSSDDSSVDEPKRMPAASKKATKTSSASATKKPSTANMDPSDIDDSNDPLVISEDMLTKNIQTHPEMRYFTLTKGYLLYMVMAQGNTADSYSVSRCRDDKRTIEISSTCRLSGQDVITALMTAPVNNQGVRVPTVVQQETPEELVVSQLDSTFMSMSNQLDDMLGDPRETNLPVNQTFIRFPKEVKAETDPWKMDREGGELIEYNFIMFMH